MLVERLEREVVAAQAALKAAKEEGEALAKASVQEVGKQAGRGHRLFGEVMDERRAGRSIAGRGRACLWACVRERM